MNASSQFATTQLPLPLEKEYLMTLTVLSYFWPAIILFGLVSNIMNVVIFLKVGPKDNVTILLIALAMSDLAFLILISPTMCGFLIFALVKPYSWPFDYNLLFFTVHWPAITMYDNSAYISVSLGVMRCACVAMPLKFKLVFTKSRTIKWLMLVLVAAVLLRLPMLTVNRIAWRKDPVTNVSTPYLASKNQVSMSLIMDILNRSIIVYLAYIAMIGCTIILSFKLYQASKIRQSCAATVGQPSDQSAPEKQVSQGLSSRDLQVVKSVVLVCSIFIIAQMPQVVLSTTRLINPEVDHGKYYQFVFSFFNQIIYTCCYLNASVNIFVYYNCNSKYRLVFLSFMHIKNTKKCSQTCM
ncbi:chemosensory receptor A [Elysia marginata]|uniref:Chemosensory receptor A n=1 Tax=Elysia marginata TaxID=1093978 RepID=A0AAV4FJP8_9GAST|nr:chemosensory receptor A [Elysia marginata]